MQRIPIAINECVDCGHIWKDFPGEHAQVKVIIDGREERRCPNCHGVYWKWTNNNKSPGRGESP